VQLQIAMKNANHTFATVLELAFVAAFKIAKHYSRQIKTQIFAKSNALENKPRVRQLITMVRSQSMRVHCKTLFSQTMA
jgi:hypothetical protein